MDNIKTTGIDEEVKQIIAEEQVELGISDEKQMRRTELNFYCELLSQFKALNKDLDGLQETMNIAFADKMTAYYRELAENFKREEKRVAVQKQAKKSHATKKSV
jgi:hypothetical protein